MVNELRPIYTSLEMGSQPVALEKTRKTIIDMDPTNPYLGNTPKITTEALSIFQEENKHPKYNISLGTTTVAEGDGSIEEKFRKINEFLNLKEQPINKKPLSPENDNPY